RELARAGGPREYQFEIPPPRTAATLYYYFSTTWPGDTALAATTPAEGSRAPFLFFVSQDHLGDLDAHGDLLDVFDVVRLLRHAAWGEPVRFADRLRAAGVDSLESAVRTLIGSAALASVNGRDAVAVAQFVDGSSLEVPRDWSGRITDVT